MKIVLVMLALMGLSGSWRGEAGSVVLRETEDGLEIDGFRHPYEGPEPGSSNFLLTRLTRTAGGYHLYCESRRTVQESGGPIRLIFLETETDYELTAEGRLRVTTLSDNGTRRWMSEYWRVDD